MANVRWQAFFAATHRLSHQKLRTLAAKHGVSDPGVLTHLRLRAALPATIIKLGRRMASRQFTIDGEMLTDARLRSLCAKQCNLEIFLTNMGAATIEWQA